MSLLSSFAIGSGQMVSPRQSYSGEPTMYCRIALYVAICGLGVLCGPASLEAGAEPSRAEVAAALRKGVGFYRGNVSINGGYLWRYSADLSIREGEGKAGAETAWVQPPGTPTVGEAYLRAYRLTGDEYYLDAARETALALWSSKAECGCWAAGIPATRRTFRESATMKSGVQPTVPTGFW